MRIIYHLQDKKGYPMGDYYDREKAKKAIINDIKVAKVVIEIIKNDTYKYYIYY